MKTKIYSNKTLIGSADLKISDESMGVISGEFIASEGYYSIRENVREFNSSKNKNYVLWNNLRFNAQLENGYFIHSIGGISIGDFQEVTNEKIEIDIAGVLKPSIVDFFKSETLAEFVEEPWECITINQKIAFENELEKEIEEDKGFLNWLKGSKKKHPMTGYDFSALCTSGINDDVLFSIDKRNSDYAFALIHLTWSQKKEIENNPKPTFFKTFEDFKHNKMIPDKIDWEE